MANDIREEDVNIPRAKAPIFQVAESSPLLMDKHAAFLGAGGERMLAAIQDTVQTGLWPWDKPAEQTAQFGAFCAGVAWACKILRELNLMVQNRQELGSMVATALSSASDESEVKKLLIRDYGFSEKDFE
jgi:hypothetical protein